MPANDDNLNENKSLSKEEVLKLYFGFDSFRQNQEEIITNILNGKNVLAIMPTGAGKSLCYQIPAIMSQGVTIVISPLISLMTDQVMKLKNIGINCAAINGMLSNDEYLKVKKDILSGKTKILYIAPERLLNSDFISFASKLDVRLIVIDEAHCISQWGHDFRKSYLNIIDFVKMPKTKPVMAMFTATATRMVQDDIINILGLNDCKVIKSSFDRPNLYISKEYLTSKQKCAKLLSYLKKYKDKFGIVYCMTRKKVDYLHYILNKNGIKAGKYHAGMTDIERKNNQNDFVYDRISVIVATNAFGMGIDKSNVNYIIHYNCPKDIESYYQEIGRAGRDGTNADCILFYNKKDFLTAKRLLDMTYEQEKLKDDYNPANALQIYKNKLKNLEKMKELCLTNECIKKYILNYFGETKFETCNKCSNCGTNFVQVNKISSLVNNSLNSNDVTDECNIILDLVYEYNKKYGISTLVSILKGRIYKNYKQNLSNSKHFKVLSYRTGAYIEKLFDKLLVERYLEVINRLYPTIGITPKGLIQLETSKNRIYLTPSSPSLKPKSNSTIDITLLKELKEVRLKLAKENNMPAYIIFSDHTLESMCQLLPESIDEILYVSGVGRYKATRYGAYFIEAIKKYKDNKRYAN